MIDLKLETETIITHLKRGGIILYPTDTVWGLGCDAVNSDAIDKLNKIKQRGADKSLICLVSDFKMLQQYVEEVPEVAYDVLKYAKKPTTIIYDNPIRVAENIIASDNSLGIRVVRDPFVGKLIRKFKKPLVSTSANFSGNPTPKTFEDINPELIKLVDYVCKTPLNSKHKKPSAIIKIGSDSTVKIIRK
ncbi:L-threonylcarbamoyladenylate synthase [Aquimarina agarivorans]|uniref:L-threonylcarbamoyladenylate synthase n=1 Tax=Aquimarina agarivorans TaxID=980584 RepID=UPI000248EFFA|nr:L-threonylcarbamoyladenylate synthase [Aquimarina agarivorans]